ncbi:MAG TPA: hypothetical protein VN937_03940, partial [Blastocatellia bacterium]|nr:hypothetical protein [Blastocatellia bacterium]
MNSFFTFDFLLDDAISPGRPPRFAVVFCSKEELEVERLIEKLALFLEDSFPPDHLIVLGSYPLLKPLADLGVDARLIERLPEVTRLSTPPSVTTLYFDIDGKIYDARTRVQLNDAALVEGIRRGGFYSLFSRRQPILESSPSHHYVKQSGKHTDKFIRTGNVLISSAEVSFIASYLLRHLTQEVTHIYCDTASISVVAYALVSLKRWMDPTFRSPTIDSFSSYQHVRDFHFQERSLFLISSSTSGDLARILVDEHKIERKRIVTLFWAGETETEGEILCDLTKDFEGTPAAFGAIASYPEGKCDLCRQNSPAIRISGDQFLPHNPDVVALLLKRNHAPRWLKPFMEEWAGKGVIRCFHEEGPSGAKMEIFLDLEEVYSADSESLVKRFPRHGAKLVKILTQCIPASLCRIIHLDDPASQAMAKLVKLEHQRHMASSSQVEIKSARNVSRFSTENVKNQGTTLVVASSILSGRSLMACSQSLRKIQTNDAIVFVVGLARTRHESVVEEVQSNLTHGKYGTGTYGFHCVDQVFVPDDTSDEELSWDAERNLLTKMTERYSEEADFPRDLVNDRLRDITVGEATEKKGLVNRLFWQSPFDREELEIRPNFALFDLFRGGLSPSQADLYFTMSAILHSLRTPAKGGASLLHHDHQRVLLAPSNFQRFNDGVLQAALLRAAHKAEIDYRVSEDERAKMKRILGFLFDNLDNEHGEASVEFLVAMASERL